MIYVDVIGYKVVCDLRNNTVFFVLCIFKEKIISNGVDMNLHMHGLYFKHILNTYLIF